MANTIFLAYLYAIDIIRGRLLLGADNKEQQKVDSGN
jgi:hypothetical protein